MELLIRDHYISTASQPKLQAPKSIAIDLIKFLFTCNKYKELY
jgi:hypothetical protein